MRNNRRVQRRVWLSAHNRRRIVVALGIAAGLFVVANASLWVVYRERTYPRTKVANISIGNMAYSDLSQKVGTAAVLPQAIELEFGALTATVPLAELGIRKDASRTVSSANRQRSWLPIANLFAAPRLEAPAAVDNRTFNQKAKELAGTFRKDAVHARLTLSGATVGVQEGKQGYELRTDKLQSAVLSALDAGKQHVVAPTRQTTPAVAGRDLQDDRQALQQQIDTPVVYRYNGKSKQPSRKEVAAWYVPSGDVYAISSDKLQAYISEVGKAFGIRVKDTAQVAAATTQSLANHKPVDLALTAQIAAKTFTYCTAVKGVDASHLSALRTKLQGTYGAVRGWSLDGLIEFKEVSSGCNFTVWLTAAELMPTFGAICDPEWSCRVGPNVVINFNRWQNASPAWNAAGGTLDEYRSMVINHETGHWLGFGHSHCSGAGQPAAVMQQQSINLEGCTFNAWPVTSELATLRRDLGL